MQKEVSHNIKNVNEVTDATVHSQMLNYFSLRNFWY